MQTTQLQIEGMTCMHCAARVEKALTRVPGVHEAKVELPNRAAVQHDHVPADELVRAVQAAGDYRARVNP